MAGLVFCLKLFKKKNKLIWLCCMKLSEILDIIYSNFHFRMDSNLLSDSDKYNEK